MFEQIKDPFSSLRFEYEKMKGRKWLRIDAEGKLSGIPSRAMAGLNLFNVKIFDKNMGLSGVCTFGIYVKNPAGGNGSVFLDFPTDVQTAKTKDDPEIVTIRGARFGSKTCAYFKNYCGKSKKVFFD